MILLGLYVSTSGADPLPSGAETLPSGAETLPAEAPAVLGLSDGACGTPTGPVIPGSRYLFEAYSELDHGASPQSWVVKQDPTGRIWIGNTTGFLEFDGVEWRRHQLPRQQPVRALDVAADGTVWVAGGKDVGYLAPDESGRTQFVSVADRLPSDVEFGEFWSVNCTSGGVWIQADRAAFFDSREAPDSVMAAHIAGSAGFGRAASIENTVYFADGNANLYVANSSGEVHRERLERDGPRLLEPEQGFVTYALVQLPDRGILVASNRGLFRRTSEGRLSRFGSPVLQSAIERYAAYSLARLSDGYAIGTLGAGVLFVDFEGHITSHLDTDVGFPDDIVLGLYLDREGALWAALDSGIARIEVGGPFLTWESHNRLRGGLLDLLVTDERLLVAGSHGLWTLDKGDEQFQLQSIGACWDIERVGEELLVGTSGGLATIEDGVAHPFGASQTVFCLAPLRSQPGRVVAGRNDGLFVLERGPLGWTPVDSVDIGLNVLTAVEAGDGSVFASTQGDGVRRISFDSDGSHQVEVFGEAEGIPPGITRVFRVRDRILAGTSRGLFRFEPDTAGGRFVVCDFLDPSGEVSDQPIRDIAEDGSGVVWIVADDELLAVRRVDGRPTIDRTPTGCLPPRGGGFLHVDDHGRLWIGRDDGLFLHRGAVASEPPDVLVNLRSVTAGDSLLFGGEGSLREMHPEIGPDHAGLRFEFVTSSWARPGTTVYSTRLVGLDEEWGPWTTETWRDYTSLPPGRFSFQVRARDVSGRAGVSDPFVFSIRPPWHMNPWFRGLVALGLSALLIGLGTLLNRLRVRMLEAEVRSRTKELAETVEQLETARADAVNATEAKSAFLATISHELRTPVAGIFGINEVLLEEDLTADQRDLVYSSCNSVEHLLRLVDDMLDLSRIESGRMKISRLPFEPRLLLENLARVVVGRRDSPDPRITMVVDTSVPRVVFSDPVRIQQILFNLVSNATKFTPEGEVRVRLTFDPNEPDCLRIEVSDTGIGIPSELLDAVFEPFVQADPSSNRRHGGTGLGLSICRHLVELLDGTITVESEVGRGSTFRVALPVTVQDSAAGGRGRMWGAAPGAESATPRFKFFARSPEGKRIPHPETRGGEELPLHLDPSVESADALPSSERTLRNGNRAASPNGGSGEGSSSVSSPRRGRVLLAEDDRLIQNLAASALERNGFEVVVVGDGQGAIDRVLTETFDVVLMDCQMPEVDGYEATRRIRREPGEAGRIPIVALTAHGQPQDRARCEEAGMDGYLVKPVSAAHLVEEVVRRMEASPVQL